MSWLLSSLFGFLATALIQYLANRRAEQALRDLGAAQQREDSRREAERHEAKARAAGDAVADASDDPRDLRD